MQDIHIIKQRIEALSFQIKNISKSRSDNVNEDFKRCAIDKNYRYNLAEVIANIIIKVNFVDNSITRFQKVIDDYNNQHSTTLNYKYFIDSCLIREILDDVVIPSVVIHSLIGTNTLEIDTDYYNCLQGYYNDCKDRKNLITSQNLCYIISKFGRGLLDISLLRDKLYIIEQIDGSDDIAFRIEHNSYLYHLSNEITSHILMQQGVNSNSLKTILNANLCNFEKLKDILLSGNLNSFCYAASVLLLNESDLNDSIHEIKKIWFDINIHENKIPKIPNINTNFTSSYDLISFIYDSPHWIEDPFSYQSSREKYNTLLELILCTSSYDFNDNTNECNYQTLLKLIKDLSTPYVVYTTYDLIKDKYTFLAPYLLIDKDTVNLGLDIIENIQINSLIHKIEDVDRISQLKHELQIKNDIWLEMFNFILDQLNDSLDITDTYQYEHISEILINLANKIFSKITFHGNGDNCQHEYLLKRYKLAIQMISSKRFYTSPYVDDTLPQIIFSLLPMLLNKASDNLEKEYEYIRHGFISLSNGSIYHAIELIKLSNTVTCSDKFYNEIISNKQRLVTTLFNKAVFFYTTTSVTVRQDRSNKVSTQAPNRQVNKVGFELISWSYFYIELMRNNLLSKLDEHISQSIIISEKGIYEDNNQQQYHKVELYLKSLMLAFIDINENIILFEGIMPNLLNQLKEVEKLIIKHSLKYSKTELKNESLDIFEYNHIFQNYNLYYQSLKSLLYKCVNLFDEETGATFISNFFANSSDLGRMLNAANSITNKNIVTLIEQKIDSVDINEYVKSANWIPEITQALIDATNSKKYWKTYAKKLFEVVNAHYEKVKTTRKLAIDKNTNDLLFEISLILAFKDNNRSEFDTIQPPECLPHENNRQNIILKEFYSILFDVYHDKNYDSAITKLKKLHTDNLDIPKFAIELFFVRTRQAISDAKLNKSLLAKAKSEFDSYLDLKRGDQNLIPELDRHDNYIKYYELYHFIAEFNSEKFDITLNQLPDELKFDVLLVPQVYEFYYKRKLNELALSYLHAAQQYISDNNPSDVSQINQLMREADDNYDNQHKVKQSLNLLNTLPAEIFPKVIPTRINNKDQLNMFILDEFIKAAMVMLYKIKSIKEVHYENKYNDLLVSILNLRFDVWGWVISDQGRGGSSASGIDAGSIDFTINSGSKRLALAEALIHSGEAYTQEHILKCFKYDPTQQLYYIIVYCNKPDLDKAWENYQKYIQGADFEENVSLIKKDTTNGFNDLNKNFEYGREIKVAKTQHNSNVEMYHIMINLNGN